MTQFGLTDFYSLINVSIDSPLTRLVLGRAWGGNAAGCSRHAQNVEVEYGPSSVLMLSQAGWSTRTSELLFAVLMFALNFLPVLVIVPIAVGQVTTSSVTGFVTDNSAAAVPEAAVTIKEVRTGFTRTATTNQLGQYSILAIPAGIYDFRVQKTALIPSSERHRPLPSSLLLGWTLCWQLGRSVRR